MILKRKEKNKVKIAVLLTLLAIVLFLLFTIEAIVVIYLILKQKKSIFVPVAENQNDVIEKEYYRDFTDLGENFTQEPSEEKNLIKELYDDEEQTVGIDMKHYQLLMGQQQEEDTVYMRDDKNFLVTFQFEEDRKEIHMNSNKMSVGRSQENDIIISWDKYVGKHHALFYIKENKLYLMDLKSKNGTFVDGKKISEEICIEKSTTVKLAATSINVIIGDEKNEKME